MGTQSSILFLTSLTSSLYNISSNPGFLNRQSLIDYKTKGAYAFKRMLNLSNIWTRQFGKTKTANHSLAYSNLWHRSPFSRCSQSWWTLQKDRKNNKMKINKNYDEKHCQATTLLCFAISISRKGEVIWNALRTMYSWPDRSSNVEEGSSTDTWSIQLSKWSR